MLAAFALVPTFTLQAAGPASIVRAPVFAAATPFVRMQLTDNEGLCLKQMIEKQLGNGGGGLVAYAMFRTECKEAFTAAAVDGKVDVAAMQTLMQNVYGTETSEEEAAAMMERSGSSASGVVGYEPWVQQFLEDCNPPKAEGEKKFFGLF
jgi:hypothetical protein